MISTRSTANPHQRLTALIAICLWLFSSTAAFLISGHADAATHLKGHGSLMPQAVGPEQNLVGALPCLHHKQVVEANIGPDTQHNGGSHGVQCADNCAMSSCGGNAVAVLPVAHGFAVNADVKASIAAFPAVQLLPPDLIYRPPSV